MPTQIEDLTWQFVEEDGLVSRRQLSKRVLDINHQWLVVLYLFQDLDRTSGQYKGPRIAFVRYRKVKGGYSKTAQFNLSVSQVSEGLPHLDRFVRDAPQLVAQLDGPPPLDPPSLGRPTLDEPG